MKIRASSWTTMRMHSIQPLKASTSHKPVSYPHRALISIDRPAFLRPGKMRFWASIPAVARPAYGPFRYLLGVVLSVFSQTQPKQFPAVGHPGIRYIRGRFVCALLRLGWGPQYRNYGLA